MAKIGDSNGSLPNLPTLERVREPPAPVRQAATAKTAPAALEWAGNVEGFVMLSPDGSFTRAKNVPYAQLKAALQKVTPNRNDALTTAALVKALDPSSLSFEDRVGLIKSLTEKRDDYDAYVPRRRDALIPLLTTAKSTERMPLAKSLFDGQVGERVIDRLGRYLNTDDADLALHNALGKEIRIERDRWGATFTSPDPTLRAQMGAVAASRQLMQGAFPFNDGPFSGIEAVVKDGKVTATLRGNPNVTLGAPFAIPATNADVQAEITKRFNTYYYGAAEAPPAFLNSLIKSDLDVKSAHPGAAIAKAVTTDAHGNRQLTLDAKTWGEFIGKPGLPAAELKAQLVREFSKYFSDNQAAKLSKQIEVSGSNLVMPLVDAKVMVEAKQLNDKAKEFFGNDREVPPGFDFVQRINNKLKFVVPYQLASAFDPATAYKPASPQDALNALAARTQDLELDTPSLAGPNNGLLSFDVDDAKRLMAASMFSYAQGAKGDLRNVYGGAQLANLAYMPFDGVAAGGRGPDGQPLYTSDNISRELEKRNAGKVPPGALAEKLARLGFTIEKEVATKLGQALVIRNDKLGLVRVVFRGSDRKEDFISDAKAFELPFTVGGKEYLAPRGFVNSVESMYPEIMKGVQSATDKLRAQGIKDVRLGIDGHSKGGAESALFAFKAQHDIEASKGQLPPIEQVNLIEPARSIGRWNPVNVKETGVAWLDGTIHWVAGKVSDNTPGARANNTAADVYRAKLGAVTSSWSMSRDIVPHLDLYFNGRVKPGDNAFLYDQSKGLTLQGNENPVTKDEPAFIDVQRKQFWGQGGVSLSAHMMGNVGPTIFGQIGSGLLPTH